MNTDSKLKNPIFKPYQITENSVKNIKENNFEFIKIIQDKLSKMVTTTSSLNQPIDQTAPETPTSNLRINNLNHDLDISEALEQFHNPTNKINKIDWNQSS